MKSAALLFYTSEINTHFKYPFWKFIPQWSFPQSGEWHPKISQ